MSSSLALLLLLLGLGVAAGVVFLLVKRPEGSANGRQGRIKFLGKDRLIIRRLTTKKCPACRKPLEAGALVATCSRNAAHEIHKACKVLVNGKCPTCGWPLE